MATTTLMYQKVTQANFDTMLLKAEAEYHVSSYKTNEFSADYKGGLVKLDGTYSPEEQSLTLVVQHPFFVSASTIKTELDSWFQAEDTTTPSPTS